MSGSSTASGCIALSVGSTAAESSFDTVFGMGGSATSVELAHAARMSKITTGMNALIGAIKSLV